MMTPKRRAEIDTTLIVIAEEECSTRSERRLHKDLTDSLAEIDRLNKVVDQAVFLLSDVTFYYADCPELGDELERRSKA